MPQAQMLHRTYIFSLAIFLTASVFPAYGAADGKPEA